MCLAEFNANSTFVSKAQNVRPPLVAVFCRTFAPLGNMLPCVEPAVWTWVSEFASVLEGGWGRQINPLCLQLDSGVFKIYLEPESPNGGGRV